jgi:hypothetical protein
MRIKQRYGRHLHHWRAFGMFLALCSAAITYWLLLQLILWAVEVLPQ